MTRQGSIDHHEEGVKIPYERIEPGTLRAMIQEFVTRDGADWGEVGGSLEEKVEEVLRQLKSKRIKVVFDLTSQTANFIAAADRAKTKFRREE